MRNALFLLASVVATTAAAQQTETNDKATDGTKHLPRTHHLVLDNDVEPGEVRDFVLTTGPLRMDDKVRLHVKNVNRLLYDVTIKGNNEVYEYEAPAGLATLLGFQVEKKVDTKEVNDNMNAQAAAEAGGPSEKSAQAEQLRSQLKILEDAQSRATLVLEGMKNLQTKYAFMQDGPELDQARQFLTSEVAAAQSDSTMQAQAAEQVKNLRKDLADLERQRAEAAEDQTRFWARVDGLTSAFKRLGADYEDLERMRALYNKLQAIALQDGFNANEVAHRLAEVNKDMPWVNDKAALLRKYRSSEDAMEVALDEFRRDPVTTKVLKDEVGVERFLKLMEGRLVKLKATVKTDDYEKLFKDIDTVYWLLSDPSMFTISSDPIQATGDVVNFTVTLKSRDTTKGLMAKQERDFTHTEYIRGGWRKDWSSGIFFQAGLNDQLFRTEPIAGDSTSVTLVANSDRQKFRPAIGGLMHLTPRVQNHFRISAVVGAGLNETNLEKTTFYLGTGLGFGRKEKIYLNMGFAGRKVDVLSGAYNEGQILSAEQVKDLTLTESVFRIGGFFSVTVTLNKQDKENNPEAKKP